MLASLNSRLYTVAALREIATRMGLTVPSKAVKSEVAALIATEVDRLHGEALKIDATREIVKIAETVTYLAPAKREGKTYTQRMISRCEGYARQNGHEYTGFIGDMIARFTPKQRRRYNKKVRAFNANH